MNTIADPIHADQQALLAALACLMEPLARLCLAKGVPIQAVEALTRQAYVNAARNACVDANPERLTSRISTMTGLTRREVARLQALDHPDLPKTRTFATDVLTYWISQPAYVTEAGQPRVLARQGAAPSFEALALSVTKDVHPRSLLAEMQRLKLVAHEPAHDTVTLLQEVFVPHGDWPQMLGFLGANVGDHLRAAVSNVLEPAPVHFEQALLADELSAESLQTARRLIEKQWRALITGLGPKLQALMDADQAAQRPQDQSVRIGLYAWADAMPPAEPQPTSPAATHLPNSESP
ncbi:DUF6502 family protein [Rhodoferax sp.]|uniref:DUF6502 family protein n=1 Tax=Rhodoferax sp. TaxID=50421 RepID=UPI00271891FE|nr:DUF6502 family protein [Rhodoferax sp.]MDO8319597.1 DUF6502 family protein [Rhodoferax sp.]